MYAWLANRVDDSTAIVTPNRRLAAALHSEYSKQQIAAGQTAWRTPSILAWPDWLLELLQQSEPTVTDPVLLNAMQSMVLWESSLRSATADVVPGVAATARLMQTTWRHLQDARVGIKEVARTAVSDDHKLFASVAGRYLAILEHNDWDDQSGVTERVLQRFASASIDLPARLVLAGFDFEPASVQSVLDAAQAAGCNVERQAMSRLRQELAIQNYDDGDAEMRAAGAWARAIIDQRPDAEIAIVRSGLEQSAQRDVRLVREGFAPGWQYGAERLRHCVNVSYGQALANYPAVGIALLALRWVVEDLRSREVATLLLSSFVAGGSPGQRSRLELRLRELPDRAWAPTMLVAALRERKNVASPTDGQAETDCLRRFAELAKWRRRLRGRQSLAQWAEAFGAILEQLGWPGPEVPDTEMFQLLNRWRELLNDLARLDLLVGRPDARTALQQLTGLAQATVFQPENPMASVQLLGPLEAAGGEYDAVWISGLTATIWPGPAQASPLVSRALQQKCGMPDASPAAALESAGKRFERLVNAAPDVVCSFPRSIDDVEQAPSDFLLRLGDIAEPSVTDPGWHATALLNHNGLQALRDDVPPVADEQTFGGAGTLAFQIDEPLQAFVAGRLGVRRLYRQAEGVPASLRGVVIHDALYRLYRECPDREQLRAWSDEEIRERCETAAAAAMTGHEHNTDAILLRLLQLERKRIATLLERFVVLDRGRDEFSIGGVEQQLEFSRGALRLTLRCDRIDVFPDGKINIIDYKTGTARKLATTKGDVYEPQLFVYAQAVEQPVAALALANLDPRDIGWSGAGRGFTDADLWQDMLATMQATIDTACDEFARGDVRMLVNSGKDRYLGLLSRAAEQTDE